jgi:hypothetical protein
MDYPKSDTDFNRLHSKHSVVRLTVQRAAKKCPVFRAGDVFYVRQHVLDTEVSSVRNFCYHTLSDLYPVYCRVRKGKMGGSEIFQCRDKKMVKFLVERLPGEEATIGHSDVYKPKPLT